MGNGEGTRVAGRYDLVREIGDGGWATVYEAVDLARQAIVAIKIAKPETKRSAEERMLREGQVGAHLRHRNLCRVSDYGSLEDGTAFVVMERLYGETLRSTLHRRGRLTAGAAVDIARQILSALDEAHRYGLVHRDVKPCNVFLVPRDERGPLVKLLDFGLCCRPSGDDVALTVVGTCVGTPGYMPPEQVFSTPLDARADVFAVGATLFEMLTGRRAFPGFDAEGAMLNVMKPVRAPRRLCPDLPCSLEAIVLRALAREPGDRFASAAELEEALAEISTERRVRHHTPSSQPHVPVWEAPTNAPQLGRVA